MSEDSGMGTIARAFLITGSASLIASAFALVKTRIIATLQGPEGIGLLGQFASLQGLVAGIAALGLATGIIKYLSQYLESKEYDRIEKSFSSALIMVTCCSAAAAAILIVFSSWISSLLVGDDSAQLYVVIVAVSLPVASLATVYNGLINGARAIRSLAKITIYSSLGALIIAVPAVYYLGTIGIIVQIATASAVAFVLNFAVSRRIKKKWPVGESLSLFDAKEAKLLLRFGAVPIITGLLLPLTLLITQTAVIHQEGLSKNGLFVAAWGLFWLYIGFALSSVVVYLFPTMSATTESPELSKLMNNGVRFLAVATTPIACVIILIPGIILSVIYSPEFTDASSLLRAMVVAGTFRIISFPLSLVLFAKGHLRQYMPIEASWYAVFAGIVIVLLPTLGINAIAVGVVTAYIAHSTLFTIFVKRTLALSYTRRNWLIVSTSAGLLFFILALTLLSPILPFVAAAVLVPLWLLYAAEENERGWLLSKILRRSV